MAAASSDGAGKRGKTPRAATSIITLTGLEETIQGAFHFLDGPADVLAAATACRRWRELACADSVWRARFEREGLVEKARVFEVALPLVPLVQGGGAAGGGGGIAAERDELAGVGLAFYAQVFALEVRLYYAACAAKRATRAPTYPSHHRACPPPRRPRRGTR